VFEATDFDQLKNLFDLAISYQFGRILNLELLRGGMQMEISNMIVVCHRQK